MSQLTEKKWPQSLDHFFDFPRDLNSLLREMSAQRDMLRIEVPKIESVAKGQITIK